MEHPDVGEGADVVTHMLSVFHPDPIAVMVPAAV